MYIIFRNNFYYDKKLLTFSISRNVSDWLVIDEDSIAESSRLNYPSPIIPVGAKFDRFRGNARNSLVSRKLDNV